MMRAGSTMLKVITGLAIVGLLAGGALFYHAQGVALRDEAIRDLNAVAQVKATAIAEWRAERRADGAILAGDRSFAASVAQWRRTGEAAALKTIAETLRAYLATSAYRNLLLVDARGRLLWSMNGAAGGLPEGDRAVLAQALAERRVLLSDLHRDQLHDDIGLGVFVPIQAAGEAQPVTAAVLEVPARTRLYPIIAEWPTPTTSGETVLARRDGDQVLFLNDLRFQQGTALRLTIPLTRTDLPAAQAVLGHEGVFYGRDYRGVPVVSVTRSVPDSPWALAAKIDRAEAFAVWRVRSTLIVLLTLLGVLLVGAAGVVAAQRQEKAHYEQLYRAECERRAGEARYETTLRGIGDGVVVTDVEGRVTLLNPVAEQLTGWTDSEARGRPVTEVFPIVNEYTRAEVVNPVHKVLNDGQVVNLANHTLLISRDGQERPIADSGAPVTGADGQLSGVVLVFRDQSEERSRERSLRESEESYRALIASLPDIVERHDREGRHLYVSPIVAQLVGMTATDVLGKSHADLGFPADLCAFWDAAVQRVFSSGEPYETEFDLDLLGQHGIYNWRLIPEFDAEGEVASVLTVMRDITVHRLSERTMRQLAEAVDAAPSAIMVHDATGAFKWANKRACELHGYSYDQLVRLNLRDLDVPASAELIEPRIQQIERYGEASFDVEHRCADGRILPLALYVKRIEWDGAPAMLSVGSDLTQRRLIDNTHRFLLDCGSPSTGADFFKALAGYLAESLAGDYVCIDELVGDGLSARTVAVWHDGSFLDNTTYALADTPCGQVVHDGYCWFSQHVAEQFPGDTFLAEMKAESYAGTLLWGSDGTPIGLIAVISRTPSDSPADAEAVLRLVAVRAAGEMERRRAEAALREHEALLADAGTMARFGGWTVDPAGHRVTWSRELYRLFEVDDDFQPTEDNVLAFFGPAADELAAAVRGAASEGTAFDLELAIETARGNPRWLHVVGRAKRDGGQIVAVTGACQDITERRQSEAERERLEQSLIQSQKMESVGRLAGGVAHDFNNMLSVILGHVELALEQTSAQDPLYNDLREVQAAARRSADLTSQLLAFARRQTVEPRTVSLNDLVAGSLQMLRRLVGEDMELHWRPVGELWPVHVDPAQISQIMTNLVVNARDAIAGVGEVLIETRNLTVGEDRPEWADGFREGDYVLLSVSDNGHGMDESVRASIFEPFFTTKGVGRGTGLGLATVYGVVKQNNGYIAVESAPGDGATFRILLPRWHEELPEDHVEEPYLGELEGTESILLVEDEPAILGVAERILAEAGYQVLVAGSPAEARHLAERHAGGIDLLVTDVIMPQMSGRELADLLTAEYSALRTIFISGYTADVIARHGVLEPGVHFLQKPFSREALLSKVRQVLDGR